MLLHEVAGWNASARLGGLEDEGVISRREGLEMLRTDRVSYDITKEPVEYCINRGRVERTLVSFDVVI